MCKVYIDRKHVFINKRYATEIGMNDKSRAIISAREARIYIYYGRLVDLHLSLRYKGKSIIFTRWYWSCGSKWKTLVRGKARASVSKSMLYHQTQRPCLGTLRLYAAWWCAGSIYATVNALWFGAFLTAVFYLTMAVLSQLFIYIIPGATFPASNLFFSFFS